MSARKQKPTQNSSEFDGFQTLLKPSESLFRPVETSQVTIAAAFLDHTKKSLNNSIKKAIKYIVVLDKTKPLNRSIQEEYVI